MQVKSIVFSVVVFILYVSMACEKKSSVIDINFEDVASRIELYDTYLFDSSAKVVFQYNAIGNPGGKVRGYQGCPSIGYLNGKLYVAWVAGVREEELGNYIPIATSSDMGSSWNQNVLILAPMQDSVRHFDPSFWTDKFGNLRMSWNMSNGMWDGGIGGNWSIRIKEQNGHTIISKPRKLFNGVMNVKPIQIGKDSSSILFPVSGWNIREGYFNGMFFNKTRDDINGAFLYKSNYDLVNKQLLTPKKLIKLPTTQPRVHDELMVVDLGNGKWRCMFRTENGIYSSMSIDAGASWSEQAPFTDLGPTAVSRFYFGRLKSGNLLLVMNASKQREKLTAFLSTDNGDSWPYKVLIDARRGCSYPDVVQNDLGEICLVHDFGRYPNGEILFTKFTEEDIKSGDISRIRVTKLSSVK